MARTIRSAKLDSKSARKDLERKKRHQEPLSQGVYLAYRRPEGEVAGSWLLRTVDPLTKAEGQERLGTADDLMPADGENVLTYPQAKDKAKEVIKLREKRAKLEVEGRIKRKESYTVADAMEDYLEEARRLGKRGLAQVEAATRAHILPTLGTVEVVKLTMDQLKKWLKALAEAPRRTRGKHGGPAVYLAAPKTADEKRRRRDSANRVWTSLRAALNHACKEGVVDDDTAWKAVRSYQGTTSTRKRHLNIADTQRLVNACPPDLRRIVAGAIHTGARYGELRQLRVRDFDNDNGQLYIPVEVDKNHKGRHVALMEEGWAFFRELVAGRKGPELIFVRVGVLRRKHKDIGSAWAKGDQNRILDKACEDAGIERCTFHELRHTAVSLWLNHGVGIEDVAEQIGDSVATTRKHYAHLCPDSRAQRMRKKAPTLGINEPAKVGDLKIKGA